MRNIASPGRTDATRKAGLVDFITGITQFQIKACFYNIEELMPIITIPLYTFASLAILVAAGRADLASYALVGVFLMTVTQLALFVSGDILYSEEHARLLVLHLASPSHYGAVVLIRSGVISALSLIGMIESYLIARFAFSLHIEVLHPYVFCATIILTLIAASAHGLLITGLLSMASNPRTYQNIVSGPLYLLGGILVPVTHLPDWLTFCSPLVFLFWSADLLRSSYQVELLPDTFTKLAALTFISIASTFIAMKVFSSRVKKLSNCGEHN